MAFSTWLIYFSVIALLIATPGPSALLCMSHGARHGKTKTIATVLGGDIAVTPSSDDAERPAGTSVRTLFRKGFLAGYAAIAARSRVRWSGSARRAFSSA